MLYSSSSTTAKSFKDNSSNSFFEHKPFFPDNVHTATNSINNNSSAVGNRPNSRNQQTYFNLKKRVDLNQNRLENPFQNPRRWSSFSQASRK
jgi:hypothetical protein